MFHFLPHLHARVPLITIRRAPRARIAHPPLHHKFRHERLLQYRSVQHFLLYGQLRLQSFTVRLRPHEARVHELHLLQSLDALDAKRQQLFALEIGADPVLGRLQVALALRAIRDDAVFADALGDVNLRAHALDAHAARVRVHRDRAQAAQHAPRVARAIARGRRAEHRDARREVRATPGGCDD